MSANLHDLMEAAAASPSRPVDAGRVWRRGRRRLWARRAASTVVVASLLAGGWATVADGLFSARDLRPARFGEVTRLPVHSGALAPTQDALWVNATWEVYRLDVSSGRPDVIVTPVPMRGDLGIAVGGGAVWTFGWTGSPNDTATARGRVYRIHLDLLDAPSLDRFTTFRDVGTRIALRGDHAPYDGAYGFGSLWLADAANDYLIRIGDGDDPAARVRVPVGGTPEAVTVYDGSVWVLRDHRRGSELPGPSLVEVDPRTNRVVGEPVPVGDCTNHVAGGEGALWTTDACTGRILRIDRATHAIEASADLGHGALAVAVGHGAAWVVVEDGSGVRARVVRVDAKTMETATVVDGVDAGGVRQTIAVAHGALWVSGPSDLVRVELDP